MGRQREHGEGLIDDLASFVAREDKMKLNANHVEAESLGGRFGGSYVLLVAGGTGARRS
jgi:hypothetical protein